MDAPDQIAEEMGAPASLLSAPVDPSTNPISPPESAFSISPAANAPSLPTINSPRVDYPKVGRVRDLFYRARSARQPIIDQWARNYRTVHNRAWLPGRASHLPAPAVAEVYPIIAAIVAWMSDSSPTYDVTPAADPNTDAFKRQTILGNDLRTCLRAAAFANDYDEEFQKHLWDGNIYGIGFLKTLWDGSAHMGLGDAITRRVDPFAFYPDPSATDIKSAQYLIETQELNDDQLETRFPGALAVVGTAAGVDDTDRAPSLTGDDIGAAPKANSGPMGGISNQGMGLPGQTRRGSGGREDTESDRHLLIECWWQRVTPAGQRWWVTVICGNAVLLEIPATDAWSHGDQPFDRWVPVETGEFWGMSLVELLAPAQKSINRITAAIESNIDLVGNPILMDDVGSGISRTQITNRPGQRLSKNNGRDVHWMDPPQMHPDMAMNYVTFLVGEMEKISGLSAMTRGATPTGRNSQGVLDSVQEAAFVRIRMALRNYEVTLRRQGNKAAALIAEFYTAKRVVSFVGASGESTVLGLGGKHFYVPDRNSDSPSPIKFSLHVQAGSTVPTSRAARSAEADALFAMGAIDEEAVLQAHDFPNWPTVVERVRTAKSAAGTMGEPPSARTAAGRTA